MITYQILYKGGGVTAHAFVQNLQLAFLATTIHECFAIIPECNPVYFIASCARCTDRQDVYVHCDACVIFTIEPPTVSYMLVYGVALR